MKKIFLTQPYLLSLKPNKKMTIVWISTIKGKGFVTYGENETCENSKKAKCYKIKGIKIPKEGKKYGEARDDENLQEFPVYQYIATVKGERGKKLFYSCHLGNECTKTYHFHFAPEDGENFKFSQMSDLQGKNPCEKTVHCAGTFHPDFLLYSGDCTSRAFKATDWFDLGDDSQTEEEKIRAFFPCMQQEDGAELMQYCPTFICPGNHEVDDIRYGREPEVAKDESTWKWSIYMQLFRPYYKHHKKHYGYKGKKWFSVNYGEMHISSLSVSRWAMYSAYENPGWKLCNPIGKKSKQYKWLKKDLKKAKTPFKWIIEHWHLLNKGDDVQPNLCNPVIDKEGNVTYPKNDARDLMRLCEDYRVNGMTYGHSHVYERYFVNGTHYIESAYFGLCFRSENAPSHPDGYEPIVEDNTRQSFLIVERTEDGLVGNGYYADENPILFDRYKICDKTGKPQNYKL